MVVTGASGGTGQSIVRGFRDAGYAVQEIDIEDRGVTVGDYKQLDLRDGDGLNDAFAGACGVIHFGSHPGDGHLSTSAAWDNFMTAGFNVFQAARNCGIKRVAWASSIEVYGDITLHPSLPVTEDSPLAPPGIYGASKQLLEQLAEHYCRWYGMSIAGFRLSRIIYDNEAGRAKLKQVVEDDGWGSDCLWAYVDARDVASACLAWIESSVEGSHV